MNVLVTGGTGFLGSHIVAALVRRGDRVRVLHRARSSLVALEGLPVEHVVGDILDLEAVQRGVQGCDLVFHVAAVSSYWRARPREIYRANVEGTRTVMAACLAARVPRVVHTSSAAAIGVPRDGIPADETMQFDAFSAAWPYADSKHRAETEVYRAVEAGLNAVIVNPAVIIGPGDHYLISSSMVVEFARRPIPAVPPGGICVADVDAVVQGHLAAAERGRVGERYILGGENLSNLQVARTICEIAGRPAPRWTIPAGMIGPLAAGVDLLGRISRSALPISGEQLRLGALKIYYESRKAVQELGYPLLPFRPAAERAYRWYREHGYLT